MRGFLSFSLGVFSKVGAFYECLSKMCFLYVFQRWFFIGVFL